MMRNLVAYPISQGEAVRMLQVEATGHQEIGGLLPYLLGYIAGKIAKMTPEEWAHFAAGLNP